MDLHYDEIKLLQQSITSNFLFNDIAGKNKQNPSIHDLKNQLELIKEEVRELEDALTHNNAVEVLDAVIDIQVVLSGLHQQLINSGMLVGSAAKLVAYNNLTKFTDSLQVANMTVDDLQKKGVKSRVEYNSNHVRYVIKDENNKVRKPIDYVSVDLTSCVPANLIRAGFE